jgi:hypothetical protein
MSTGDHEEQKDFRWIGCHQNQDKTTRPKSLKSRTGVLDEAGTS